MFKALFLGIVLVVTATLPAAAQTVYAVLVGDTQDPDIGNGVRVNLDHMRSYLHQVQNEGKIAVVVREVTEDQFDCSNILKAVRTVPATANDTVVFYYAGHGFRRTDSQTKFPEFDCRRTTSVDRADLSGVANYFLKFGAGRRAAAPRLLIAIADACNVVINDNEVPRQAGPKTFSLPNREPALKQLFLQYSGTLIMSGAQPGSEAWYMQTSGGFFTNKLIVALDAHTRSVADARWEAIADDATKQILIPADTATVQTPQYAPSNLQLATQ